MVGRTKMSKTKISWTDETANWIVGCTKTRAKGSKESGCTNCYAATAANSPRLQQFDQYKDVVDGNGNWNGEIAFVPKVLGQLLRSTKKRRVFAPSMSDPFHPGVKDEWLDQFFAVVARTPHITYQCLTKRPERMLAYFDRLEPDKSKMSPRHLSIAAGVPWPLKNLWLGTSVENQNAADKRIIALLGRPTPVPFLSLEPMLEHIDLRDVEFAGIILDCLTGCYDASDLPVLGVSSQGVMEKVSWVIIGGESGKDARPFHLEWAHSIIRQCRGTGVKVFMKQVGSNAFYQGQPFKTRSRAGSDPAEWPEWAQIQEFPEST
jgi:protein gp37